MKKNMGIADRIIRILASISIIIFYFADVISGGTAAVLLILSGIFIATSFMSFCPLYLIFGISSRKKQD